MVSRQWIYENAEAWSAKCEENEKQGNHAKHGDRRPWRAASEAFFLQEAQFVKICDHGRDKEDGDVEPIGGFADSAVVGIKKDGNQNLPKKDGSQSDAGKVPPILKEKALHEGED